MCCMQCGGFQLMLGSESPRPSFMLCSLANCAACWTEGCERISCMYGSSSLPAMSMCLAFSSVTCSTAKWSRGVSLLNVAFPGR